MKLSDYVIHYIADLGVRHVFLVPGGGAMHLNDSLSRCPSIEFVCTLHEQAAAIAAENYSKATNHLGVALVTTGPGATNAITGLVGAWLDSTPCLFISGQVKRPDRMYDANGLHLGVRQIGVQEVDIVPMIESVTKYALTVTDPQSIRFHLDQAVHLATTGRPGPVWLDIPLDVQAVPIDVDTLPRFTATASPPTLSSPELDDRVSKTIRSLNESERPLLLAGNGIRLARSEKEFQDLVATLGIPVETTWLALDLIGDEHPLLVGRPGAIAPRGANFAVQNCDLLLSVGARLDRVITGFRPEDFAKRAWKIVVDIDAAELAKFGESVHTKVLADAGRFMRALLDRRDEIIPRQRLAWTRRCREWKTRYPLVLPEHREPAGPVSVYHFADVMSDVLESTDFVVSGSSGSGIELFLLALRVKAGQRIFHTTALGAMGFGIAAAVGACLAGNRRRTICVDGDGGFQFNIQELETVARLQLPITFFVLNNDGYASIRASQTAFFGEPRIGCDHRTGQTLPDVRAVARAYGIDTAIIEDQSDLREAVRRVISSPGPIVCDVRVVPDEVRQPRLSSVQRSDGSFESKPLEDLWPFLERDEFVANMTWPNDED